MKRLAIPIIIVLSLGMSSCGFLITDYYQKVNYTDFHKIQIKNEEMFTFSMEREREELSIKGDSIPSNFTFVEYQVVNSAEIDTNKLIVEKTYMYLEGIDSSRKSGRAFYFFTTPMVNPRTQKEYFNTQNEVPMNIVKQVNIGYWTLDSLLTVSIIEDKMAYALRGKLDKKGNFLMEEIIHPEDKVKIYTRFGRKYKRPDDKKGLYITNYTDIPALFRFSAYVKVTKIVDSDKDYLMFRKNNSNENVTYGINRNFQNKKFLGISNTPNANLNTVTNLGYSCNRFFIIDSNKVTHEFYRSQGRNFLRKMRKKKKVQVLDLPVYVNR